MPQLPFATLAELGLDLSRLEAAYDRLDEWTSGKDPPISGGAILVGHQAFGHKGSTANLLWMDPATGGYCILLPTAERARAPWRLVHLSNPIAAAFL